MWWISGWFLLYAISLFGLIFGIQRLRADRAGKKNMSIDELTVVIPFRNEVEHLEAFFNCIRSQRDQPIQWIFVNDHSEDDFQHLFNSMSSFPVRLVHLPLDQRGKKRAIRFGIDHATTDYCLTMDADVEFGKEYIKSMLVLPVADLVILPVVMTSSRWWHPFFTLEYLFTCALNRGVAGWSRPVNCSGANLLFHIASFDEVDDIEEHDHVLSGDDMYTLRAFRDANKTIEIVELETLQVTTPTPNSIAAVMEQRVRWMSKSNHVGDQLNNFLGVWAVVLHLVYFFLVLVTWFAGAYWFTIALVILKSMVDCALIRTIQPKWNVSITVGLLLFELFYPIYLFALMCSAMISQPDWKGRGIINSIDED